MRKPAATALVLMLLAGTALAGCGNAGEAGVEGLARGVDKASDASAMSSLQQGLVAAGIVRAESGDVYGAGPDDLAAKLQAKNPSLRFGTAGSGGPDSVQVVGGGGAPATLVVRSNSGSYVAAWTDGGSTLYYRGDQPPAVGAGQPSGAGWGTSPVG